MQLCAKGGLSVQGRYLRYRCVSIGIERIPLLASSQGGVAERLIKCREASADYEAGVVFRRRTQRKTTPAASASVASQHFLDDAASPPCGDARRGITRQRNFFTAARSAATAARSAGFLERLQRSVSRIQRPQG